ncbi:unnamed protein product [Leptosia nina]|uniref:Coiled-coil domain-containing protein 149 n=1 Tax=Leptosia nina TaxID=320188 RepID=A0AAV1K3Z5_9NEOP
MFVNKIVKVQFPDQQIDDYVLENSVLKSKLQSKIDALSIMSRELDKCCMDRDKYKTLVEQMKCKKVDIDNIPSSNKYAPTNTISGGEIVAKTKEHNTMLKLEVETLQSKLDEAHGDIVALRKQLQKSTADHSDGKTFSPVENISIDFEHLLQELERVQKENRQVQMDYRAALDEKEELMSDRNYYKSKVQQLNHQISFLLTNRGKELAESNGKSLLDIDALVMENKYLHETITQLQVEKEIVKRALTKYKALLDSRSKNNMINLRNDFADVMTQQQVREYLSNNSKTGLKRTSVTELKSLCLGLFEALNDKSIALQHQRKTNQILANRISELEKTMENWCNGQKVIPIFPSQMLMEDSFNDSTSVHSDEYGKNEKDQFIKESFNPNNSGVTNGECDISCEKNLSKIVLPEDLQQLVREALAELKST